MTTVAGRSLRGLRTVFEATRAVRPDAVALECGASSLTYAELDVRANRLAHYLAAAGVRPGGRVGIRLPRSVDAYVALLAVVKAGAVFVPIDPAAPPDRVTFIAADAALSLLLCAEPPARTPPCPVLRMSEIEPRVAGYPPWQPEPEPVPDAAAYVIYTSGSTGRPKGVEVAQSSIMHFLEVATPIYRVCPGDRVYQGMTLAFDFSIEEIWPTWAVGATLVAGPEGEGRFGAGLATFLAERRITVLYCVPTVLATLDAELPALRTVIVGGEACPAELVRRWSRVGRLMLNTYGPTETTVTATWAELHPGRPVTIGRPLPGYRVELLDEHLRPVPDGTVGEICVSGPGVARGYLNRPELTAERFRRTEHGRVYRTGDLGRVLPGGEIAFLGRADSEVKIRGHRVDLQEVEGLLLADDAVTGAAAKPLSGGTGLAAYVTTGVAAPDLPARLLELLRRNLPGYLVPSHLEVLDTLPTLPSGKVDRGALPEPGGGRTLPRSGPVLAPATPAERAIVTVWAEVLDLAPERVSVTADFFTDLGGHSLLATTVVGRLRAEGTAPGLSVAELYAKPTVRGLAGTIERHGPRERTVEPDALVPRRGVVARAGLAQLACRLALLLLIGAPVAAVVAVRGGAPDATVLWQGGLVALASLLPGRLLLPILGVRLLSAGLRPGDYPLWGGTHVRVWLIGQLLALAPLGSLGGSPLLGPYLRALGARVGAGCQLATAGITLPSLTEIGAGAAVGYGARLETVRVTGGVLTLGHVCLGARAFVGAGAVLAPGCRVADGGQLAEHSLLAAGQSVPPGRRWTGSPAASDDPDPVLAAVERLPAVPPWSGRLLLGFAVSWLAVELLPFAAAVPGLLLVCRALAGGAGAALLAALAAGPLFVFTTCLLVLAGKHAVLRRTPTGILPARSALGVRKYLSDKLLEISLATTPTLYATLYTVGWLRALGARIGPRSEVSTVAHIDPDLLRLGAECFLADQVMAGPAVHHRDYLVLGNTTMERRSFAGNAALARSGSLLGAGSLVGAHSLAPRHAPTGTSWIGSPPIRLPRRESSPDFAEELTFRPAPGRVAGRLAIEFLRVVLPATVLAVAVLGGFLVLLAAGRSGGLLAAVVLAPVLPLVAGLAVVLVVVCLKWIIVGRYRPRVEPLWGTFVRRTELITGLYEAAAVPALLGALAGTPLLPVLLRLFGARIGRRVWLASTFLTEFDLVRIGDDAAIGPLTSLQTHLFEDRVMKMSTVAVGAGASIGPRSVVLYDAVIGAGGNLDALSLAMKGERLEPGTDWRGIPCRAVFSAPPACPARAPVRRRPGR
ncbi:Pls/PosA family non-ribosomal peptide synthetase [Amycolatopsis aidingensis]|uniref:Pls/PosA family non-ribosomal peptide synthetase n=1 Tax=Amycolatopsis aidingensis TaxID=2842453 RepID=UPI001C0E04DE|nr:Pls/PosA family non-ribosomal peptide synthetase [Amycolatopsis aidingensis]